MLFFALQVSTVLYFMPVVSMKTILHESYIANINMIYIM